MDILHSNERQFLVESFGWHTDASFHLLQSGENDTYLVQSSMEKCVVRRYRRNRYTRDQIRGELAWMEELRHSIPIPQVLSNVEGDTVARFVGATGERLYAAFEFINGDTIESSEQSDYQKLGQMMQQLHSSSDDISKRMSDGWAGWNRPRYDVRTCVEESLARLMAFDVLTEADKFRCDQVARYLRDAFVSISSGSSFIHCDLHFGNVLTTDEDWYCLDFDECGFGHRALDIGVVRLHLRSSNQLEQHWPAFVEGYGSEKIPQEMAWGTVARIFYMMGKIPVRQDIEPLQHKPDKRIRKYLGYIESELDNFG